MPSPLSARVSSVSRPVMSWPATNVLAPNSMPTLTLEWCCEAFIASSRVAIVGGGGGCEAIGLSARTCRLALFVPVALLPTFRHHSIYRNI